MSARVRRYLLLVVAPGACRPHPPAIPPETRAACIDRVTNATIFMGIHLGINDASCHDDVTLHVERGVVTDTTIDPPGCPSEEQLTQITAWVNEQVKGPDFTGICRLGDYVGPR